jgi:hypothetical protein
MIIGKLKVNLPHKISESIGGFNHSPLLYIFQIKLNFYKEWVSRE